MTDAREKWNKIYRQGTHGTEPAAVLSRHLDLIPQQGCALDIACGKGANAIFLAAHGLRVDAWDISEVAIAHLAEQANVHDLPITAAVHDITPDLLPANCYDVILNCHYLDRSLPAAMTNSLKPGGLIVFQTFTADKRANIGPKSIEFLLQHKELLQMFDGLEVLVYEDESLSLETEDPLCGRACLIAKKAA